MAGTMAVGGEHVQRKTNPTTAEALQLGSMPPSPDWNMEAFEADLKEAFAHLKQTRETSDAAVGPKEAAAISTIRSKLLQLKGELWPADYGLLQYCKHKFGPIPVERLSAELDEAFAAWEPESWTRRTSKYLPYPMNFRYDTRLRKTMSAEFRETPAFKGIADALGQCFPVAVKQCVWEKKTEHYMKYGQALKASNVWRKQMVMSLGELIVELHDRVIEDLVHSIGPWPSRLLFRDLCHQYDFQGFLNMPPGVDSFYEPISGLDKLSNFVLRGLGQVQLSNPVATTTFDSTKRHPGCSVDVTTAALLSKKAVDRQLLKTIGVVAASVPPLLGLPRISFNPTIPPLPTSLLPYGNVIRDLALVISIPKSDKPRTPSQVFGIQDMLPNLKVSMPSLTHLRLTVAEANWNADGSARATYLSRDGKTEMTSEQVMTDLILAVRTITMEKRSIAHVVLDGPSRHVGWQERYAGSEYQMKDLKSRNEKEVAARLMQGSDLAALV